MPRVIPTPLERFMSRIDKQTNGCWYWKGFISPTGYGTFSGDFNGTKKTTLAHRASYRLFKGDIGIGLDIDHLCHNASECEGGVTCTHRRCVNPDHLAAVTRSENLLRGKNHQRKKKHCPHGHEYSAANTRSWGKYRYCKTCTTIFQEKVRRSRGQPVKLMPPKGIPVGHSWCCRCRTILEIGCFSKHGNTKRGVDGMCRKCRSAYRKEKLENGMWKTWKEKQILGIPGSSAGPVPQAAEV